MAEMSLSQRIPRPSLPVEFYRMSSRSFGRKMVVLLLLMAIGISFAVSQSIILSVVGIFLIGAMFAHAVELQHQCIHRTAFKNKFWNDLIGFLLGFPMLVSYSHYRANHLHHHRTLGTNENREFFQYSYSASDSWLTILFAAFNFRRYLLIASDMKRAFSGESYEKINKELEHRRIALEYKLLAGFASITTVMSVYQGSPLILKLWLFPLLFVAEPLHFLIELPEHFRCQTGDRSPLKNTRTIAAGRLLFWFTNGNNFHVEHHLYPQVQNDRLPDLHQMIRPSIEHLNESYLDFFKTCLSKKESATTAQEVVA
jgi:fatty acid desaturase